MELPPLIPREVFFGNPDRTTVRLSPDGEHISYLAPRDGVMNLWVAPRTDLSSARPITHDGHRGIHGYFWAHTCRHLLYIQDTDGDENWVVFCVELADGKPRSLTPASGVMADIAAVSPKYPDEIVVRLNDRDPKWHDVYRLNVVTGERSLIMRNDRFGSMLIDDYYRVRLAEASRPDGGLDLFAPDDAKLWQLWESIEPEDAWSTHLVDFDASGDTLYIKDSRGRNTAALVAVDMKTGQRNLLVEDAVADAREVLSHPKTRRVQAVAFEYERKRWQVVDESITADLAAIEAIDDGQVEVASRTLSDDYWIAVSTVDEGPARYYLYDRRTRQATFLFTNRSQLEGVKLSKMRSVVIPSRDGMDLVAYYSLPHGSDSDGDGIPDEPLAMVFTPHGGPWWRDSWGYNSWHQWLTNRGYAVLSVNFRSSTGFGKDFVNAGDLEWGGKIIEDQIDAVRWATSAGIADPKRVAAFGGSFGGYSVLAGLTFHPEVFACGVDLIGPSNLMTFIESIPPYWQPFFEMLARRVGDPRTEEGRELLERHSPLHKAHRICRPLLIGQGANDPRVKKAESDQIAAAMGEKKIPVTYLLYPDEGHGFARPENTTSFHAVAEVFLARCLGGRYQPLGKDLAGSSMQVLQGEEFIEGLTEAMPRKTAK